MGGTDEASPNLPKLTEGTSANTTESDNVAENTVVDAFPIEMSAGASTGSPTLDGPDGDEKLSMGPVDGTTANDAKGDDDNDDAATNVTTATEATEGTVIGKKLLIAVKAKDAREVADLLNLHVEEVKNIEGMLQEGVNSLQLAIFFSTVDVVRSILNLSPADATHVDSSGHGALHYAVTSPNGSLDTCTLIIQAGASTDKTDTDGYTPVHLAAGEGQYEMLKVMCDNCNIDLHARTKTGMTPLLCAASQGQVHTLGYIMEKDPLTVDAVDNQGHNALHFTTSLRTGHLCTALLAALPQAVDMMVAPDADGITPLAISQVQKGKMIEKHDAVSGLSLEALGDAGGEMQWPASMGQGDLGVGTPHSTGHSSISDEVIYWRQSRPASRESSKMGNERSRPSAPPSRESARAVSTAPKRSIPELISLMQSQQLSENELPREAGTTILHQAALLGQLELAQEAIRLGTDINSVDGSGRAAIHFAVSSELKHLDMVQMLTRLGADFTIADQTGMTALHYASGEGRQDFVDFLLRNGAAVDAVANEEEQAIHVAAMQGHVPVVVSLLRANAGVECTDKLNQTPLHAAVAGGHGGMVSFLLHQDAQVNPRTTTRRCPIHLAAMWGSVDAIRALIGFDANVGVRDSDGNAPLHLAAMGGWLDATVVLVSEASVNIRQQSTDLSTALMKAAEFGHPPVVEYLCSVDPMGLFVKNVNGSTIVHLACGPHSNVATLELVLLMGAPFQEKDNDGKTPFDVLEQTIIGGERRSQDCAAAMQVLMQSEAALQLQSVYRGHIVRKVLEMMRQTEATIFLQSMYRGHRVRKSIGDLMSGQTVAAVLAAARQGSVAELRIMQVTGAIMGEDEDGNTAVHHATLDGNATAVGLLVECGLDVTALNKAGLAPIHLACRKGLLHMLRYLIGLGADPNQPDDDGLCPLHWASTNGNLEAVEFLLGLKAIDVNTGQGSKHGTALLVAAKNAELDIVVALLENPVVDMAGMDSDGNTALHLAATSDNNLPLVALLVVAGAESTTINNAGATPTMVSSTVDQPALVRMFKGDERWKEMFGVSDVAPQEQFCLGQMMVTAAGDFEGYLRGEVAEDFLREASEEGFIHGVEFVIANGIEWKADARDSDGDSALHLASMNGHTPLLQLLASNKVDIFGVNNQQLTILHSAALSGVLATVDEALRLGVDRASVNDTGCTALHTAAMHGYVDLVQYMCRSSKEGLHIGDHNGATPLFLAVQMGEIGVVQFIATRDPTTLESRDLSHSTVMHYAAQNDKCCEVLSYLLTLPAAAASYKTLNDAGNTPTNIAFELRNHKILRILRAHKLQDGAAVSRPGSRPLTRQLTKKYSNPDDAARKVQSIARGHWARVFARDALVQFRASFDLVIQDCEEGRAWKAGPVLDVFPMIVEATDTKGNTPLHRAAFVGQTDACIMLLERGSNILAPNHHLSTPLHNAATSGNTDCVAMLIMAGSEINATDLSGWTPLHVAAAAGWLPVIKVLAIAGNADVSIVDDDARTAVMVALQRGHLDIASFLSNRALTGALTSGRTSRNPTVGEGENIRGAYRVRLHAKRLNATLLLQCAVRQHQAKENLKRAHLATLKLAFLLQRCVRGHFGRHIGAIVVAARRRRQAALMIQRTFRSHTARGVYANAVAAEMDRRQRLIAATKLQSVYRGHRVRIPYAHLTRLRLERLRKTCAMRIWNVYRGHLARRLILRLRFRRERREAVMLIQRNVRGQLGRDFFFYKQEENAFHAIAAVLQAKVRRIVARVVYDQERFWQENVSSIAKMQNTVRIYQWSKNAWSRSRYRTAREERKDQEKNALKATVTIQQAIRAHYAREEVRELLTRVWRSAPFVIQTQYLMHQIRGRSWQVQNNNRRDTVTRLQAVVRGHHDRQEVERLREQKTVKRARTSREIEHDAAVIIQRLGRGWVACRWFRQKWDREMPPRKALILQGAFRFRLARKRFVWARRQKQRSSARLLQQAFLCHRARNLLRRLMLPRVTACTKIQKVMRGHFARVPMRQAQAVGQIQAVYRGHRYRILARFAKKQFADDRKKRLHTAAVTIQTAWWSYLCYAAPNRRGRGSRGFYRAAALMFCDERDDDDSGHLGAIADKQHTAQVRASTAMESDYHSGLKVAEEIPFSTRPIMLASKTVGGPVKARPVTVGSAESPFRGHLRRLEEAKRYTSTWIGPRTPDEVAIHLSEINAPPVRTPMSTATLRTASLGSPHALSKVNLSDMSAINDALCRVRPAWALSPPMASYRYSPNFFKEEYLLEFRRLLSHNDTIGCIEIMEKNLWDHALILTAEQRVETMGQIITFANIHAMQRSTPSGTGLTLLRKAEQMTSAKNGNSLGPLRLKFRIWTLDNIACYFYRKGKCNAAHDYCHKSFETAVDTGSKEQLALRSSHMGVILSRLGKHQEALKHALDAIRIIEPSIALASGQLVRTSASRIPFTQQKTAVACLHNIALELNLLFEIDMACEYSSLAVELCEETFSRDHPEQHRVSHFNRLLQSKLKIEGGKGAGAAQRKENKRIAAERAAGRRPSLESLGPNSPMRRATASAGSTMQHQHPSTPLSSINRPATSANGDFGGSGKRSGLHSSSGLRTTDMSPKTTGGHRHDSLSFLGSSPKHAGSSPPNDLGGAVAGRNTSPSGNSTTGTGTSMSGSAVGSRGSARKVPFLERPSTSSGVERLDSSHAKDPVDRVDTKELSSASWARSAFAPSDVGIADDVVDSVDEEIVFEEELGESDAYGQQSSGRTTVLK